MRTALQSLLRLRLILLILALTSLHAALAADPSDTGPRIPTLTELQEAVAAAKDTAVLQPVRDNLERIKALQGEAAALRETARLADRRIDKLKREGNPAGLLPSPGADVAAMEQALDSAQKQLSETQSRLAQLEDELIALTAQPAQARIEIANLIAEQAGLTKSLADNAAAFSPSAPAFLAQATRYHLMEAEIQLRQAQLQTHPMRLALLTAERDAARDLRRSLQARVDLLIQRLGRSRLRSADQAATQTKRAIEQVDSQHPLVNTLAAENAALSQELTQLAQQLDQVSRTNEDTARQMEEVQALYRSAQTQIEIAGVGQALSRVLHEQRKRLPDLKAYRQQARMRSEQIAETRLRQFQIEEKRRELDDTVQRARALLLTYDAETPLTTRETDNLLAELELLLDSQKDLLERLSRSYLTLIDRLGQLDLNQKQLTQIGADYTRLLDENLLWIASDPPIRGAWFGELLAELVTLGEPARWRRVGRALTAEAQERPLTVALGVLILGLALRGRRRLRQYLLSTRDRVADPAQDHFGLTVGAIFASFVLALPIPLLAGLLGWMLGNQAGTDRFIFGLGNGLTHAAWIGWVIESFRRLSMRGGVLEGHFRWQPQTRELLYRNLRWLVLLTGLATVLMRLAAAEPQGLSMAVLGRATFISFSIGLLVFTARIFHPMQGVLGNWLQAHRNSWAWRGRQVGYALVLIFAALLALMPIFGYTYTAVQLQARVFFSGWLMAASALMISLLIRGLSVSLRRIEVARIGSRLLEGLNRPDAAASAAPGGEGDIKPPPEAMMDLETMNEQVRTLLTLALAVMVVGGLYMIWGDTFSALRVLDRVTLWSITEAGSDGPVTRAITLGSIGLALMALAFTLGAARNIPGLLEVLVLQRQSVDAGTRYAATLLSRYAIFLVGLLIVVNQLGIDWSKAQWLVAALSVGLGFGLQEIVANFVAGIIILFERPVRIGDTVTVGGVSGTVSRIRIRATTILDWDRKELIIPNKSFVTDPVVNWTLSDLTTRVVVPIGIAYGADPQQALTVMETTVRENPLILKDPPPAVLFIGFGDSSLNFELRVFAKNLGDSVAVRHQLHLALERALREAGIEIPFPQRDVHLRSITAEAAERLRSLPKDAPEDRH
ncbi:MAG TPA: mechanosensitive ion channel domain-containing protein [Candidatus Macondimonas sp.]|nr:mechanosensitive ion channel domain-containing protein [Candidatus Macondimonas sp.]